MSEILIASAIVAVAILISAGVIVRAVDDLRRTTADLNHFVRTDIKELDGWLAQIADNTQRHVS